MKPLLALFAIFLPLSVLAATPRAAEDADAPVTVAEQAPPVPKRTGKSTTGKPAIERPTAKVRTTHKAATAPRTPQSAAIRRKPR